MTQVHLFIVHFIPINIASAPSQIIRHQLPEVWDPWFKPPGLYFVVVVVGLLMQFVDQCPRIDVFTEERKWYFCVSSTQTRP